MIILIFHLLRLRRVVLQKMMIHLVDQAVVVLLAEEELLAGDPPQMKIAHFGS